MKILQSPIPQIIAVPLLINVAAVFCASRSASQWQDACRLGNVADSEEGTARHTAVRTGVTDQCRVG